MAPQTRDKAPGTGNAFIFQRICGIVPFSSHRIAHRQAVLQIDGVAVGANTLLGKARNFMGQFFRFFPYF